MFSKQLIHYKSEILTKYQPQFQRLDAISEENTLKVIDQAEDGIRDT